MVRTASPKELKEKQQNCIKKPQKCVLGGATFHQSALYFNVFEERRKYK